MSWLLSSATAYNIAVKSCHESSDADVKRVYRLVATTVHPDKGGCTHDAQQLNAARDDWLAALKQSTAGSTPPPPPPTSATSRTEPSTAASRRVRHNRKSSPASTQPPLSLQAPHADFRVRGMASKNIKKIYSTRTPFRVEHVFFSTKRACLMIVALSFVFSIVFAKKKATRLMDGINITDTEHQSNGWSHV